MIVSPHPDDGVLSCGQLMAGRPDVIVVTVFAGVPPRRRMLTTYDKESGFRSAADAMTARAAEDAAALSRLAAHQVLLPFLDNQYRDPLGGEDIAQIADAVEATINASGTRIVVGPLGLVHPDHETVRVAVQAIAARRADLEVWVYEDLPSRVLYPEAVPPALAWWQDRGYSPRLGFLGTGPIEQKAAALAEYRSQQWALDPHCCLVPERHWMLT